jgi:hypothetical protein
MLHEEACKLRLCDTDILQVADVCSMSYSHYDRKGAAGPELKDNKQTMLQPCTVLCWVMSIVFNTP